MCQLTSALLECPWTSEQINPSQFQCAELRLTPCSGVPDGGNPYFPAGINKVSHYPDINCVTRSSSPRGLCTLTGPAKLCAGSYSDIWAKVFPCVYGSCVKRKKMMFSCLMNCKIISTLSANKNTRDAKSGRRKCPSLLDNNNRYAVCMHVHAPAHTQSWAVTAFYSCLIRKTDGVSVSSPAPKGCWWRLCMCAPIWLQEKWWRSCCVSAAREEETLPTRMCVNTFTHEHTHTHTAGGCQNVLQKLSCVQFSLLHPLCSFILSPPFIYLYPFAHPLIAQQPCSSSPLLLSSRWEWKKILRLRTWLSTLHAQPEERKHKSTSIKIIGGEHLLIQPAAMRGCVCESLSTIGRAAGLHHTEEGLNIKHPFFSLKQWNVQERQHWLLGSDL